jgi:ABC-type multidrug transport system fused ATPase/permease subunit
MIAQAKIHRSREYYEEDFEQWRRYISRRHQWEFWLSLSALIAGLVFFFLWHFRITGLFLITVAVVELALFFLQKPLWVSSKLRHQGADTEFELFFHEDHIEIFVRSFKGKVLWRDVKRTFRTPSGVFLWIKQGSHIYIPRESIAPVDAFEKIVQKCIKPM